jgi:hypothetical protein
VIAYQQYLDPATGNDDYIQPQHTPLPAEMPPYLDFADYDLVSADGSHEPPPLLEEPPLREEEHQQILE